MLRHRERRIKYFALVTSVVRRPRHDNATTASRYTRHHIARYEAITPHRGRAKLTRSRTRWVEIRALRCRPRARPSRVWCVAWRRRVAVGEIQHTRQIERHSNPRRHVQALTRRTLGTTTGATHRISSFPSLVAVSLSSPCSVPTYSTAMRRGRAKARTCRSGRHRCVRYPERFVRPSLRSISSHHLARFVSPPRSPLQTC